MSEIQNEVQPNQQQTPLADYLQYYRSLEAPGFAVLVTGPFGTGKTHQVRRCLPADKYVYVSLFGVQTVEQLHAELLAAAFPTRQKISNFLQKAFETVKGIGGYAALAGAAPSVVNVLLRRELKTEHTIVFDDLERCSLEPKDLLGSINIYVEQRGFQVVVIAHDEAIAKKDPAAKKEKIFGQVIQIEPETREAFESFLTRLPSQNTQAFIRAYMDTILETFAQSQESSLRILRHVVEDLGRLHITLTDQHTAHEQAMRNLVGLFSAFDIEMRREFLTPEDLRDRASKISLFEMQHYRNGDEETDPPPLYVSDEKYAALSLKSELLPDEVLSSIFVQGRYDQSAIQTALNRSSYFITPSEAPPWLVVLHFDEMEDDELEQAIARMQRQFDERAVTDSGEMLHIFALRLLMVENGALEGSLEEQVRSCQNYIDDILEDGRLPPRELDLRWADAFASAYNGYGYYVTTKCEPFFNEIRTHLYSARERAFEREHPRVAEELLELMKTDSHKFLEQISPTASSPGLYLFVPVLSAIEPETFVDTWLSAPHENWRNIQYALDGRFSQGRVVEDMLRAEKEWACEVYQLLLGRAEKLSGLTALRLRRVIPDELKKLFEHEKSAKAQSVSDG